MDNCNCIPIFIAGLFIIILLLCLLAYFAGKMLRNIEDDVEQTSNQYMDSAFYNQYVDSAFYECKPVEKSPYDHEKHRKKRCS